MKRLDFGSGHNPKPGYLTCDITQAPFLDYSFDPENYKITAEDGEFDEVFIRNVIHHVPDLDRMFEEIHRVVKPSGIVMIEDCSEEHYSANKILDKLWYRFVIPRPEVFISESYRNCLDILKERFIVDKREFEEEKEKIRLLKK
jgi:ubiquinone/menaquinone biosynthesis C-methylase UbiE